MKSFDQIKKYIFVPVSYTHLNKEIANLILDAGFPHIIIGHPSFESRLCWVDTNHALAGEYAAAHMICLLYTSSGPLL